MFKRLTILLAGAAVGFGASLGGASLADAAMQADWATVRAMLPQKPDVNAAQADGSTALLWAAHFDALEAARVLLKAGANANTANHYGISALTEAAINGDPAMIQALLDAGADANYAQPEGETVLMTASRSGNPDAVKLLLDHGANVNASEHWRGQTALMWAVAENHAAVASLLIARGADTNAKSGVFDYRSLKPKAGSVAMNFPRGGFTALLFAARQGGMESAQILLQAGANVNETDPDGTSALLVAIVNYHYDLAGYLLNHGADPNLADGKGRTALYAAIDMRNVDVSTRPNPQVLDKLSALDVIEALLAHGANPNARLTGVIPPRGVLDGADRTMDQGATPFMRAAKSDDVAVMRLLLQKGADPKLATKDQTNALMVAAGSGWRDGKSRGSEKDAVQAIQICLDHGLDVNAATGKGETALHGAASRGADSVIQFLADKGARFDARDQQGRTPLDIAMGVGAEAGGVRAPKESTVALLRKLTPAAAQSPVASAAAAASATAPR